MSLSRAAFYILLSLRDRERHGYDILKSVDALARGSLGLGPATLYTNLARMLDAGLIVEVDGNAEGDDQRRRYYRLSGQGRRALAAEVKDMEHAVQVAGIRQLRPAR